MTNPSRKFHSAPFSHTASSNSDGILHFSAACFSIRLIFLISTSQLPADVEDLSHEGEMHQPRPLINIWIPSVFVKGKGSDAHHLYQVCSSQ